MIIRAACIHVRLYGTLGSATPPSRETVGAAFWGDNRSCLVERQSELPFRDTVGAAFNSRGTLTGHTQANSPRGINVFLFIHDYWVQTCQM